MMSGDLRTTCVCVSFERDVGGYRKEIAQSAIGVVQRLLDSGADPTVRDSESRLPVDLARAASRDETIGLLTDS
jgi:hypothetical protein